MANAQAFESGYQQGYDVLAQKRARKQALSDTELYGKINDLIQKRTALVTKASSLQQGTPEYDETFNALRQVDTDLRTTYHPDNNPKAIEKFGHLLTDHLKLTKPEDRVKEEAAKREQGIAGDERQARQEVAAGPLSPTQTSTSKAQADAAGNLVTMQATLKNLHTLFPDATPEQMKTWQNELAQTMIGVKPIAEKYFSQLMTTKDAEGKDHYWRVPMDPEASPEEVDFNGQTMVPKTHSSASKYSMNVESYKKLHNIPADQYLTPDQLNFVEQQIALSSAAPSTNITTSVKQDVNGMLVPVTEANRHIPGFGKILSDPLGIPSPVPSSGGNTPSITPKPKGVAKATPTPAGGGTTTVGKPLFQGRTPAIAKAQNDVVEATKLDSIAKQVSLKPNDAVNQKRLAVALERASAGRFTVQALDYIIKAGWGNTIQQWANNPTTGALPPDVLRQLVDGAHENLKAAQEALKASLTPIEGTTQGSSGDEDIDAIVKALNAKPATGRTGEKK